MTKSPAPSPVEPNPAPDPDDDALQSFIAGEAMIWLAHPNVAGVMFGRKRIAGVETGENAIVFRVDRKLEDRGEILSIGSKPLPPEIEIGGRRYATDVIEGGYRANAGIGTTVNPRQRFPFICPGVSISNAGVAGDAGTGTAVVRDQKTGLLALLSCDHVLGRRDGTGFAIQPGRADNPAPSDVFGRLMRQMRNLDGDAAIAAIERRPAEARVPGLGIAINQVALPAPGQLVVKAGRSTGITFGMVSAHTGVMRVLYRDSAPIQVRGFEITAIDNHATMEGDSGAPWLLADPQTKQAIGTLIGIHTASTPDGKGAFACFAPVIFERLGIELASVTDFAPSGRGPTAQGAVASGQPAMMRVAARSGLILRAGAGTDFEKLGVLEHGTEIRRLGTSGAWTKVDLRGDGIADGFAYTEFLELAGAAPVSFRLPVTSENTTVHPIAGEGDSIHWPSDLGGVS